MRTPAACIAALAVVMAAACTEDASSPTEVESLTVPVMNRANAPEARNFRAHAEGGEEVPPVDTRAQGQASFKLSKDGDELSYRLIVANIEDVTQAHIHQAPAGSNGPIVAWLYPSGSVQEPELIPGRTQGILAEGVITDADLVGPLAGMQLEDLLDVIRTGEAYVNVHTVAHPPGEIRGQIH